MLLIRSVLHEVMPLCRALHVASADHLQQCHMQSCATTNFLYVAVTDPLSRVQFVEVGS
jgi:hypothetical protein